MPKLLIRILLVCFIDVAFSTAFAQPLEPRQEISVASDKDLEWGSFAVFSITDRTIRRAYVGSFDPQKLKRDDDFVLYLRYIPYRLEVGKRDTYRATGVNFHILDSQPCIDALDSSKKIQTLIFSSKGSKSDKIEPYALPLLEFNSGHNYLCERGGKKYLLSYELKERKYREDRDPPYFHYQVVVRIKRE